MIASMLTIPEPNEQNEQLFQQFTKTPGVLATYRLQRTDGSKGIEVFTVWDSKQSRDAYNGTSLRKDVDQANPGGTRTIFQVLNSK